MTFIPLVAALAALARCQVAAAPAAQPVSVAPAACVTPKSKDTGQTYQACSGGGRTSSCEIYEPSLSDPCRAQDGNRVPTVQLKTDGGNVSAVKTLSTQNYLDVHYDYFGKSDCRTTGTRSLKSIVRVMIHNGGRSAEDNFNAWKCRAASSHYTIERDGTVYQHVGEERVAWSVAGGWNQDGIGVELNTAQNCDDDKYTAGKDYLTKYRDEVVANCAPTDAQYASLSTLIRAIATRTAVTYDVEHVVGHCENGTASDPLAFDWKKIGLSNKDKKAYLKKEAGADCRWYIGEDDPKTP